MPWFKKLQDFSSWELTLRPGVTAAPPSESLLEAGTQPRPTGTDCDQTTSNGHLCYSEQHRFASRFSGPHRNLGHRGPSLSGWPDALLYTVREAEGLSNQVAYPWLHSSFWAQVTADPQHQSPDLVGSHVPLETKPELLQPLCLPDKVLPASGSGKVS